MGWVGPGPHPVALNRPRFVATVHFSGKFGDPPPPVCLPARRANGGHFERACRQANLELRTSNVLAGKGPRTDTRPNVLAGCSALKEPPQDLLAGKQHGRGCPFTDACQQGISIARGLYSLAGKQIEGTPIHSCLPARNFNSEWHRTCLTTPALASTPSRKARAQDIFSYFNTLDGSNGYLQSTTDALSQTTSYLVGRQCGVDPGGDECFSRRMGNCFGNAILAREDAAWELTSA